MAVFESSNISETGEVTQVTQRLQSVSDFNNDEPGRLLFAAVSYMYMYTCTSACNTIRERGEGGREGGREGREGGREGGRGGRKGRRRGREGGREGGL